MKLLRFVTYLFYKYYSTGPTKQIPYLSSILAVGMLCFIHIAQILILFNWIKILPQGHKSELSTWLKMAVFIAPIFLLLTLLIKKSDIDSQSYSENKIKRGYLWLIIYIIVSIFTMVLLIMYKKGKL